VERAIESGRCAVDGLANGIRQLHLGSRHWLAIEPGDHATDNHLGVNLSDHLRTGRTLDNSCSSNECKQQAQARRAR
jgi:hypothetical protein